MDIDGEVGRDSYHELIGKAECIIRAFAKWNCAEVHFSHAKLPRVPI
jgi:hypothetical protein